MSEEGDVIVSSRRPWKRGLLASFVTLASAGLIVGLIAAFRPDLYSFNKDDSSGSPSTKSSTSTLNDAQKDTPLYPSSGYAPEEDLSQLPAAVLPATPAAPTASTITETTTAKTPTAGQLEGLSGQKKPTSSSTIGKNFVSSILNNKASGGGAACVPKDGPSFVQMAQDPNSCGLITLLPGTRYNVGASEVVITGRKIIIGNPIASPILDASGAKRLFRVAAGGSLDLQWVITWRGGGELIETIPVLRGGSAMVELGGRASFFGVIFTNAPPSSLPPILIAPDLSRAVRVFGGQVFIAGGVVTFTLCHFWVLQPGVLLREIYVVGADVLVVAGVAILSGCTFTNSQLFLNGFGAGFQLAVLGGVLIGSGVTLTINFLAINATGAGILSFIGGGVAIFSGCTWNANLGLLSHFGCGIFIFLGAGVLVVTGGAFAANIGIGVEAGTAIMTSVGGGTITMTGCAQELSVGIDFFAGAGILNFLGAGSAVNVGVAMARSIAIAGIYGTGGSQHVGAGDLISIASPSTDNYAIVGAVVIGGDWFLGAGILVEIACPVVKNIALMWAVLIGINGFVGAGGAVVGYSPVKLNLGLVWVNTKHPPATAYYVSGQAVAPAPGQTKFFIDKYGLTDLSNKTDHRDLQSYGGYTSSFTVLDDDNHLNDGTPNAMVTAVQNGPAGSGPVKVDAQYANVNGATKCDTCGFKGSVDNQFIGETAELCTTQDKTCSIDSTQVVGEDGSYKTLPQWMKDAAATYDPSAPADQLPTIDTQVVTATYRVGCSGTKTAPASCASADDLTKLITANVADCARVNVAPSNAVRHSELADDIPSNVDKAFPTSQTTSIFDLAFTTHDTGCADQMKQWVEDYSPSQIQADLQAAAPSGTHIDTSDATYTDQHNVPGLNMNQAIKGLKKVVAQHASMGGLVPAVVVGADTASANQLSLPTLPAGKMVPIEIAGFTAGSPVDFQITARCAVLTDGTDLGSFTPSSTNSAATVIIPQSMKPGTYSIKAIQNGLGWCSQPIDVVRA